VSVTIRTEGLTKTFGSTSWGARSSWACRRATWSPSPRRRGCSGSISGDHPSDRGHDRTAWLRTGDRRRDRRRRLSDQLARTISSPMGWACLTGVCWSRSVSSSRSSRCGSPSARSQLRGRGGPHRFGRPRQGQLGPWTL